MPLRSRALLGGLALLACALNLSDPAASRDLRQSLVWAPADAQSARDEPKIGLVARDPAKRSMDYETVMLTCGPTGVRFSLWPVDARALGHGLLQGRSLDLTLITDGQAHEFGKPTISFNEMDEAWTYEISGQTVDRVRAIARARQIRLFGEGLDLTLPTDAAALTRFADRCDARADRGARSREGWRASEISPRAPTGFTEVIATPGKGQTPATLQESSKPVRAVAGTQSVPVSGPTTVEEDRRAIEQLKQQIAWLGAQAARARANHVREPGGHTAQAEPALPAAIASVEAVLARENKAAVQAVMRDVHALSDARSGLRDGDADRAACGRDLGCQLIVLTAQVKDLNPSAHAALQAEMRRRAKPGRRVYQEEVGDCHATTIRRLGDAANGPLRAPDPDGFSTGVSVVYANGQFQFGRDDTPALRRSRTGDPVSLCLVAKPRGCPRGDERGKVHLGLNLRTDEIWKLSDAPHLCGGA